MATSTTTTHQSWSNAFIWGFGVALAQRMFLGLWMGGVWLAAGRFFADSADFQTPNGTPIPALEGFQNIIFGVWRRWDAIHYLNLAANGYTPANESLSVFPPLTAWGIGLFAAITPPPLDIGAMIFSTVAFGLALTFLYRLCQVYLEDKELAPWAVTLTVLMPLGHFFSAPMSEGIYLAMTLGTFYFAARGNFWAAALCGFLATLARTQGVLLAPIALFIIVEQVWHGANPWRERFWHIVRKGYPLAFVALAPILYGIYRSALGFRSLDTLYAEESYRFFVNPLEGLWINLRYWLAVDPLGVDSLAVVIVLTLTAAFISRKKLRHLPLTLYTVAFQIVFLTPINFQYGTDNITNTQSFGRYALVLFPLTLLVADWLRNGGKWRRLIGVCLFLTLMLGLSARHVLGILGP